MNNNNHRKYTKKEYKTMAEAAAAARFWSLPYTFIVETNGGYALRTPPKGRSA